MEEGKRQQIVFGQHVTEEKQQIARKMRREMTAAEAALWTCLRGGALGIHFRRQQIIDGFIADFYCNPPALVVEVGGAGHEAAYDAERDRIFTGRGLTVVRFPNRQVLKQMDDVLLEIRQHLPRHK